MAKPPSDIERLTHLALEEAKGDFPTAAVLLNIKTKALHTRVAGNPRLSARWKTSKESPPPDASLAIHRPTDGIEEISPVLPTELEVAEALRKEDEAIRRGLTSLNLPEQCVTIAKACEDFQRKHWRSTLDSMGGGINRQFWIVQVELDKINNRLEVGDVPAQEQFMLREDRARLLDILAKFHDKTTAGLLIQAKIHQMVKGNDREKTKKPKGFLNLNAANDEVQQ